MFGNARGKGALHSASQLLVVIALGLSLHTHAGELTDLPPTAQDFCVIEPPANLALAKAVVPKQSSASHASHSVTRVQTDLPYAYDNSAARLEVSAAFYQLNADVYDFIFVFSSFDFPTPSTALAYYNPVRNPTAGLNIPNYDLGAAYGSPKQLQGYIDMAWVNRYSFNRTHPNYIYMMQTAMHEFTHRYGPKVGYLDGTGQRRDDLNNPTNPSHWSYALDTDASIMYGARWTLQPDNSYRATQIRERLSSMDLYLAGWAPPSLVDPLKLLQIQPFPSGNMPVLGSLVQATTTTVPLSQVIAAEGARVPAFPASQTKYRAALVLLTRPSEPALSDHLIKLEMFRSAFEEYFNSMSGGRASISFRRELVSGSPTAPTPLSIAQPTGSSGLGAAVNYLESLAYSMPVQDRNTTAVRDTMALYLALSAGKPTSTIITPALNWLKQAAVKSSDAAGAVLLADPANAPALAKLMQSRAANKFALSSEHTATKFDSALAASALAKVSGQSQLAEELRVELGNAAIGYTESGQARLVPTIQAAIELSRAPNSLPQLQALVTFIRARYRSEGMFFEGSERDLLAAALVLQHGIALGFTTVELDQIEARLKEAQGYAGDLRGSVYLTALAALGFEANNRPDLTLSAPPEIPVGALYSGETVPVRFTVKNIGKSSAAASTAGLSLKQADGSYLPVAATVNFQAIAAGASSSALILGFDTTGKTGRVDLAVNLDTLGQVSERSETNNAYAFSIEVTATPQLPELGVASLVVAPEIVQNLPQGLQINVGVRNVGSAPATNVLIGLYRVNGSELEFVSEQAKSLGPGALEPLSFALEVVSPQQRNYAVIIDRLNAVAEANETNNRRDFIVQFQSSVDLQLLNSNMSFIPAAPHVGDMLGTRIKVQNLGTVDANNVLVRLNSVVGTARTLKASQTIAKILAGESSEIILNTLLLTPGELTLEVLVDPNNQLAETSETNNSSIKSVLVADQVERGLTEWNDVFTGEGGPDWISGLGGSDRILGNGGNDRLSGGGGVDQLYCGSVGSCELDGGPGDDSVNAGGDGSVLTGGLGDDLVTGARNSIAKYKLGDGSDTINPGTGLVLNLGVGLNPASVTKRREDNSLILVMPDQATITLKDLFNPSLQYSLEIRFDDGMAWSFISLRDGTLPVFRNDDTPDGVSGTPLADNYDALAGFDGVYGGFGDDLIRGGTGNDTLRGDADNDTLYGDAGKDELVGGTGNDNSYGGSGNDQISDGLESGSGNDLLDGGEGNDFVAASDGDDQLFGGSGRDALYGGVGNDQLTGGLGRDNLNGGPGIDRYYFNAGDGSDLIVDEAPNTLVLGVAPDAIALVKVEQTIFVRFLLNPSDQIRATGLERIEFSNGVAWGVAELNAQSVNQTGSPTVLTDGPGADLLTIDHSADQITGPGGGIDQVMSAIDFNLRLGLEKLTLTGNLSLSATSADRGGLFEGNISNNQFGEPNNVIDFGSNQMSGGPGDDLYFIGRRFIGASPVNNQLAAVRELANEGNDEVVVVFGQIGSSKHKGWRPRTLAAGTASNIEKVIYQEFCQEVYVGFSLCEVLGSDGNDVMDASEGQGFYLNGLSGADTYIGGWMTRGYIIDNSGDQIIDDGSGINSVYSQIDYTLRTDFENLILFGNQPIVATGSNAQDMLSGEWNAAPNILRGGLGDDTYVVGSNDTIVELEGEGSDSIMIRQDRTLDPAVSVENIIMFDVDGLPNDLEHSNCPCVAIGDSRDNRLTGNREMNFLNGGSGNDILEGKGGFDRLYGGAGNDLLVGSGYSHAGTGNDRVSGVYVDFQRGDGQDVVTASTWLRVKGYTAAELSVRRDEKSLILENAVVGDRLILENYFVGADCGDIDRYIEFGDGTVRTCSDFLDLIPIATLRLDSVISVAGQPALMRATVGLGQYGETVERVEFLVNGALLSSDALAPFEASVSLANVGSVGVLAKAYLVGGKVLTAYGSASFAATSAPYVALQSPSDYERAVRNLPFLLQAYAEAMPGRAISKVEFLADSVVIGQDTTAPYEFSWTVWTASNVAVTARTTDNTGATSDSVVANLQTYSTSSGPAVSITNPAFGETIPLGQARTVLANATPGAGRNITKLDAFVNGVLLGTDLTAPYSFAWTPTIAGTAELTVRAIDSANEVGTSSGIVVNVVAAAPSVVLTAPTANAVLPVNQSATVSADAQASSGRTVSKVEFYSGTTLLNTDTASPYSYSWTPTAAGAVNLTAKATDSANAVTTSAVISVTINAAIAGPTVSITAPAANAQLTVNQATSITASATANGGRTVSKVEFYSGTTLLSTDTTSPYAYSWTPTVTGAVDLTAKATDSANAVTTSAIIAVTVNAAITGPNVSITAPSANAQLTVNQATLFNASATANGGRTITKVEFFSGSTLLNTDTTSPYAYTWTPNATGALSLTVKATDSANAVTTSTVVAVTIIAAVAGPTVNITAPAANAQLTANQTTSINANASANGGRTVTKVEFFAGATLLGTDTASPYTFSWTPSAAGAVSLSAKATDSASASTTSAAVAVTVNAAIAPPTVDLTAPAASAQLVVNRVASLTANASAGSGRTISKVEFFSGSTLLGTDNASPYVFSWTPSATGAVSLTAKAFDSANVTTTSAAVSVTVVAADGTPAAFGFGTANAAPNTVTTSASQTLTSFNIPIALSITGGSYSIGGGAFVTTAGTLNPGETLRLRVTSSGTRGTVKTVTLTAGGISGTYKVTTN